MPEPRSAHIIAHLAGLCLLMQALPTEADIFSSPLEGVVPHREVEVLKEARSLRVREAGKTIASFTVATGRGGRGDKARRGDQRTPLGRYHIIDVNEASRFHLFLQLDYPNVKDAFLALRTQLIARPVFDRIIKARQAGDLPPQNTPLGGQIGIHGLGEGETGEKLELHRRMDWTEGCVALTNNEVQRLRSLVSIGTPVTIRD